MSMTPSWCSLQRHRNSMACAMIRDSRRSSSASVFRSLQFDSPRLLAQNCEARHRSANRVARKISVPWSRGHPEGAAHVPKTPYGLLETTDAIVGSSCVREGFGCLGGSPETGANSRLLIAIQRLGTWH